MGSTMNKAAVWTTCIAFLAACSDSGDITPPPPPQATQMAAFGGDGQTAQVGTALPLELAVLVTDEDGAAVEGVSVSWTVIEGGGSVSPASSTTNASGVASAGFTLGPTAGQQRAQAEVSGLAGSPVVFTATATDDDTPPPPPPPPPVPTEIISSSGDQQIAPAGSVLPLQLSVLVTADRGVPVANVAVSWSVIDGGGTISPASSTTNSSGVASVTFTLGPAAGPQRAQAEVSNLAGSPVIFTATATVAPTGSELRVLGGGNNVPERFSSDLWVHGGYAYTGTYGFRSEPGNQLKVWSLGASGAPTLVTSIRIPDIGTVSDLQVNESGEILVLSAEIGDGGGIYLYSLADPAHPSLVGSELVSAGVHTVTLASIAGRSYAFAARNPGLGNQDPIPSWLIYDITEPATPTLVHREPIPPDYGIHDTFVRDGIAFVFAWNTGVIIYDVGNGIRGGSPAAPVEISRLVTSQGNVCCGPSVHNGWWFHNPVSGESRYLFIGQEGANVTGSESSGDIHVVDVSDLSSPREVAFFHLNGAGTHNFWMDEQKQVLYAAYYNGGVVALDVSGTLSGNLADRLISRVRPGGSRNTFTWGVQLANGFLYAIDMLSGLWQLTTE
jgi:hypothetical protein